MIPKSSRNILDSSPLSSAQACSISPGIMACVTRSSKTCAVLSSAESRHPSPVIDRPVSLTGDRPAIVDSKAPPSGGPTSGKSPCEDAPLGVPGADVAPRSSDLS